MPAINTIAPLRHTTYLTMKLARLCCMLCLILLLFPTSAQTTSKQSRPSCHQLPHGIIVCCSRLPSGRIVCCYRYPSGRIFCPHSHSTENIPDTQEMTP